VGNFRGDSVSILRGNGDGTFQARMKYAVGDGPETVAIGDLNSDGKPDLALGYLSGGTVSILTNTVDLPAWNATYPQAESINVRNPE